MYDALLKHTAGISGSRVLESLGLRVNEYVVLTAHRPENVDDVEALKGVMEAVIQLEELTFVFPVHPRTLKRLKETGLLKKLKKTKHVKVGDPVGYHGMLQLVKNARMVFTDSGGLQKEAFWLRTFCVTLRERTEWVETVELGANVLVGSDRDRIVGKAREYLAISSLESRLKALKNPFGEGDASAKIVKVLKEAC